jgi:hypothetical protein
LGRTGMDSTQTMIERPLVFFIKTSIIDKILTIRLEGLFWARYKVACSFGFGLWAWSLEASHYAQPKTSITILYWLFSTQFFGLSTKFDHPIPQFWFLFILTLDVLAFKNFKNLNPMTSRLRRPYIVLKWQQCPNSFWGQSQKCIL